MNREQAKKLLPIIQAFADGAEVQRTSMVFTGWHDEAAPNFIADVEWRIKPKPLEGWVTVYSLSDGRQILGSIYGIQDEALRNQDCAGCRVVHVHEVDQ